MVTGSRMSALNIIFSEKVHVHPKDFAQPRIPTLTMGLTAQFNETEWAEWSIVLSVRRAVNWRSKMMDIIVSSNGLPHQKAFATSTSVCYFYCWPIKLTNIWTSVYSFLFLGDPHNVAFISEEKAVHPLYIAQAVVVTWLKTNNRRRGQKCQIWLSHASLDNEGCFGANLRFSLFVLSSQNSLWLRPYHVPTYWCDGVLQAAEQTELQTIIMLVKLCSSANNP